MAEVRASSHILAAMDYPLGEFARRMNTLLHQSTDRKSFVPLFAAIIDPGKDSLTFVNAGHPPPFIRSGGTVRALSKGTLPLGALGAFPHHAPRDEAFFAGDVLVAYTDGLFEQTNPDGEQFGEERIRRSILSEGLPEGPSGARALTRRLLDDLGAFARGTLPGDDTCVAVVRRTH